MNDNKLIKEFLEENFELFQNWLEDVHEIEATEAESIIDKLDE